MKSKINIKARIKRHARILKYHILSKNEWNKKIKTNYGYNFVLIFVLFLLPLYPALSWIVYWNNEYEFYRGDIDESSIIWTYSTAELEEDYNWAIIESNDSFLSINTILDWERDLSWTNEIIDYEVEPWDSISSIAYKFKVSNNSILWANNFSKWHIIHPWDMIKVPPVSWLIHQVEKWDTISSIAKKYDIEEEKIISQNLLSLEDKIKTWDVLVIPWAIKIPEPPKYNNTYVATNNNSNKVNTNTTTKATWYSFANTSKSTYTDNKWTYTLVRRKPQHTFYWWNCTWYVAQYKNVNWWWNAKDWLNNAKAKWHSTSMTPNLWSIVVLHWKWYNPKYGHVAIVMWINWSELIVSDMNYRKLWEITYRKISTNDRAIIWYIHVD